MDETVDDDRIETTSILSSIIDRQLGYRLIVNLAWVWLVDVDIWSFLNTPHPYFVL